ncbi:hypothetical protein ACY12_004440 [Salmonella enterica subsp. enterica serovar Portland]|nr:hypothetical protein [Salmonella enterica]EBX6017898.1 hypothetical protein [Salmonella enterica subsp. enterica serovar Dortmund]ECA8971496.1 hypothetical protein [Salmonella enterica subsp. enterica serovar Omuna]ECI6122842.1 hypothetical protein [Salmonella enterica subsp. enterica]EDS6038359.1 hypothetical protein [Salmonella enterica subsp. enterica serovar Lexington]EEB9694836.1 hypothetical protein [Salmonella enterica subsp. enterica serovar Miami]EEJ7234608.1 hypothetical protein 
MILIVLLLISFAAY